MSRITQREVARKAEVSLSTVSAVLSGQADLRRIAPETASRVLEVSQQIGYQPSRGVANRAAKGVGVVLRSRVRNFLGNPFYGEIFQGVEEALEQNGRHLLFSSRVENILKSGGVPNMLSQNRIDGLILLGQIDLAVVKRLLAFDVACVSVNFDYRADVASVVRDGDAEAQQAIDYLTSKGHQRIAYLTSGLGSQHSLGREQGYRKHLPANQQPIVLEAKGGDLNHGEAAVQAYLAKTGRPPFTALLVENDLMAVGAIRAMEEAGLRVPQDISVFGGGGVEIPYWNGPRVTTGAIDCAAMGRLAVKLLLDRFLDETPPVRIVVPSKLVEGESVAEINN